MSDFWSSRLPLGIRFFLLALVSLILASQTTLAKTAPPKEELRGLWVVCSSLKSSKDIQRIVAEARVHHFNALFVQVRSRGDAWYHSSYEPRAESLSGTPANFDPLAEILRDGHAAGLQIHAWVNTCFVWSAGKLPLATSHLVNQHPDWLARDIAGNYLLQACKIPGAECEGAFMSPANIQARQHIHDVILEIAERYPIDGIHFDYIRYSNKDYDYSDSALRKFQRELPDARRLNLSRREQIALTHYYPVRWQTFRCRQVTELVAGVSSDLHKLKPGLIVSAAVFADRKDALVGRGQDWNTWLKEGLLDAVVPMAYGVDTGKVAAQIADAVQCAEVNGRFAYAGLGAWHIAPTSTIDKIKVARSLGARGSVLFSYGGVTEDGQSDAYLNEVAQVCFRSASTPPVMPWLTETATRSSRLPGFYEGRTTAFRPKQSP